MNKRDDLEEHIAAFLASGGQVTQLAPTDRGLKDGEPLLTFGLPDDERAAKRAHDRSEPGPRGQAKKARGKY